MHGYGWVAIYTVGAIACPLLVFIGVLLVICCVRSARFKPRRGKQADKVPHTTEYEFYHSGSMDMDSQKIMCLLAEKGVDFKDKELDMGFFGRFEHLEDDMLRVNPNGSQPTLVHGGYPVLGAEDILQYLEAKVQGPEMLPEQEKQAIIRAIHVCSQQPVAHIKDQQGQPAWTFGMGARILSLPVMSRALEPHPLTFCSAVWALWRHPNPLPEFGMIVRALLRPFNAFNKDHHVPPAAAIRQSFAVLNHTFQELETRLSEPGQEFLCGRAFSLADCCFTAVLARLEALGLMEILLSDSTPKIKDYWERLKKRDSYRRCFKIPPSSPGLKELERCYARFRKELAEHGPVGVYKTDQDGDEEEED